MVDQITLRPVEVVSVGRLVDDLSAGRPWVVLVAAQYGAVRLLDNMEIGGEAA